MKQPIEVRAWSRGEEMANSISHALGFLGALAGTPFLLLTAAHHPGARSILGMSIFAATAMLLYLSSALHHWLTPGKAKEFLELVDHAAIFLMIAGTYTPFALGILWGPWGWLLMGVIWPLALFGVLLKAVRGLQPPVSTISLYVAMGWMMIIAFKPLSAHMPTTGLLLLLGGGISYTGGLIFYFARRFPFHHLAWHIAVLIGTTLHYLAILRYAL
jgi:hemolysin III